MTKQNSAATCDGSRHCEAETHLHGCFADRGKCDEPNEHRSAATSSESGVAPLMVKADLEHPQRDLDTGGETDSAATKRGYDKAEIERRTCQACGMLLDDAGEYHSYPMCVLKKAGLNPWPYVREMVISLGGADPGEKPPLVRNLK